MDTMRWVKIALHVAALVVGGLVADGLLSEQWVALATALTAYALPAPGQRTQS